MVQHRISHNSAQNRSVCVTKSERHAYEYLQARALQVTLKFKNIGQGLGTLPEIIRTLVEVTHVSDTYLILAERHVYSIIVQQCPFWIIHTSAPCILILWCGLYRQKIAHY